MSLALANRDLRTQVLTGTIAVLVGVAIAGIAMTDDSRSAASIVGVLAFIAIAWLSGNPRLVCLWGLMLALPLNLSKYFTTIVNKGSGEMALRIEICDPFLIMLAGFQAYEIWKGYRRGIRVPKVSYLWIGVMLLGILTIIEGPYRFGPGLEIIRMAKMLLLFVVISNELRRPKQFLHCSAALAVSILIEAAVGIAEYVRKANIGLEFLGETNAETIKILATTSEQSQRVYRVSALLLHPNIFAIFLAALLPLCLGFFLVKTGRTYKALFLVTLLSGMLALIITLSRSGWVAFAGAFSLLMTLAVLHRGLRSRSIVAAGLATIAVLAVCLTFSDEIVTRLFGSKEDASVGREVFKDDAKRMIDERPIMGWGLATYVDNLPPFMKWSREAYGGWLPPVHHIYYLWWAETGLVGLAMHLGIMFGLIWVGIENLRVKDEWLYAVNIACLAAILAFMIDGFFSFSLRISPILRTFWVLAGMIMAIRYWRIEQAQQQLAPVATEYRLPGRSFAVLRPEAKPLG